MTTFAGTLKSLLPERVKRPLRRCPGVFNPARLCRTAMYHAGIYRLIGKQVHGLHLGCGDLLIPGFWNIDAMFASSCDIVAKIDAIKLADNTVENICQAHVFEHLSRLESAAAMREWHRVLRPGGKIFIACPDLEALAKQYLKKLDSLDTPQGRQLITLIEGMIFGGQHNRYNFHYNGWSFATLGRLMADVGFSDIRLFDTQEVTFRPFRDASFAAMDGAPISLNVEATK